MRSRNEVMTPEATGLKLNDEAPSNAAHWHAKDVNCKDGTQLNVRLPKKG